MQYLENDMDDLFQRAAENYPLQSGKGDWESIAKRIADESKPEENTIVSKIKKDKKFIGLLLLLLMLSTAGWLMFENNSGKVFFALSNKINKEKADEFNKNQVEKNSGNSVKKGSDDISINEINPYNSKRNLVTSIATTSFNSGINIQTHGGEKITNEIADTENNYFNNNLAGDDYFKKNIDKILSKNLIESAEKISIKDQSLTLSINNNLNNTTNKNNNTNETKTVSQKKKGIYLGMVAGLDFSKVESTSFSSGFDAGLVVGFRMNKRFSLESGIILNKKNYSSDGSNFDMKNLGSTMPAGMTINSLQGQSSLIEIPLKGKYDIINKRNSDFFITCGVSSYIMTKEENMYDADFNGNNEKFKGVYDKMNYKIPANINISVGYEHTISRYLDFRVEPFLKIPVQGIGVGSLPVTSAGLQVGIIRRLK